MRVIDVVNERVERSDALGEAALDCGPLRGGQHSRNQVEREGTIATLAVGADDLEGDPLLDKDRVAALSRSLQRIGSEAPQRCDQRRRVRTGRPIVLQQLIIRRSRYGRVAKPRD
jgi:hypothetical protein